MNLDEVTAKLGIGDYHRHVFLCTGGKCNTEQVGEEAWDALKKLLKEKNLSLSAGPNACYRTRAGCLRVCQDGPIMVVYPEGTWYHDMSADKIPQFVQQHLVQGQPIREWIFADNPLSEDDKC